MTEKAIKILQKDPNGFFLFVEGGQIDFGHHEDQAMKALDETVEFAKAIKLAASLTDESDTLIVVTADHAHTMSMSGYPARGTNILGIYGKSKDNLPYSTLSYANGPGYRNESVAGVRHNLTKDELGKLRVREKRFVVRVRTCICVYEFFLLQTISTTGILHWCQKSWKVTEAMMWLCSRAVPGHISSLEITNRIIYL